MGFMTKLKCQESLQQETQDLLKRSITEEAVASVWKKFESALSQLDEESQFVFHQFLEGTSKDDLAKKFQMSSAQMNEWLSQIKRRVTQSLRHTSKVRQ